MPAEPRFLAIWDDFKKALQSMTRANGYYYDYGPVEEDKDIIWDGAASYDPAPVSMMYAGEQGQDETYGGETATRRFRRFDAVVVSVPVRDRDGQHSRKAARMRADLHRALMATTAAQVTATGFERSRGTAGRSGTFEARTTYQGNQDGGILGVTYYLRWDHVSGDMTTE